MRGMACITREREIRTQFRSQNMKGTYGLNQRSEFNWILKKQNLLMQIDFIWLGMRSKAEL
jgi:hypothetical protein